MIRLSEEQQAIMKCYSGTKEEVTAELRKVIPFIEDAELRELSEELLIEMENILGDEIASISGEGILDINDKFVKDAMEL